jgi:UDPglucose 6-dehydrogenase
MTNASAELTKYACNAFLATKISFINEMSQMCDLFGASIDEIRQGMGSDPRIGKAFLYPGPGFGGSCFPKDVSAIIYSAAQKDYKFQLALATNEVNQKQKIYLAQKIFKTLGEDLRDKTFAIWGLTFKANTDDIRESAAIDMINVLAQKGARFNVYDPCGMENFKALTEIDQKKLTYFDNNYDCLKAVDALIILTEWREFQTPDLTLMKSKMKSPSIFDGRNLLDVEKVLQQGFQYFGLGKGQKV